MCLLLYYLQNWITSDRLPGAMVARLASIAKWHQKVAGSSPAVVMYNFYFGPKYDYAKTTTSDVFFP